MFEIVLTRTDVCNKMIMEGRDSMYYNLVEKNKGVLVFIVLILVFSFIASRRVENLDKFNYSNSGSLVYNK